jgi:N-methylhydantoinase B/oxoprolinase/acetone carboxylase alpha subunit
MTTAGSCRPWGVNGGEPGARAQDPGKGRWHADHRAQQGRGRCGKGDQLHFITWGGGGWGDPLLRDPARRFWDSAEYAEAKRLREGTGHFDVRLIEGPSPVPVSPERSS